MLMRGRLSWQSICIGAETPNIPMAADVAPLFTDFTAKYIGLPKNLALPYYCENKPEQFGFTANPMGFNFVDLGSGGYLTARALRRIRIRCSGNSLRHSSTEYSKWPPAQCR